MYVAIKNAKNVSQKQLRNFVKTVKNTRLKNTVCFDVLGRHYHVKKRQYEYSVNPKKRNSSLRKKVT